MPMLVLRLIHRSLVPTFVALSICLPAAAQNVAPPPAAVSSAAPAMKMEKGNCPAPVWPKSSLRNEETGTVTMSFLVGPDGRVIDNKLVRSSGHPLLDEAALQSNRACRFDAPPAGAAPEWKSMQFVWTLDQAPGAARPQTPAERYFNDLGRVLAQIRTVDLTYEICAGSSDAQNAANLAAATAWKADNRALIAEVDAAYEGLPAYWAHSDPATAQAGPALMAKLNANLDEGRAFLKRQSASQLGKERIAMICANYPGILQGSAFDLEQRLSKELASIRRGPPGRTD